MQVGRVRPPVVSAAAPGRTVPENHETGDEVSLSHSGWKDGFKKVTISGACGATGLAVGYFLGGWAGGTLTNATGSALYAGYGGPVGMGLGTLWGAALYLRDDDHAVSSMITGSAVSTVAACGGLFAGAHLGPILAAWTGNALYASHAPLIATAATALAGFAFTRRNEHGVGDDIVKQAAGVALGGTVGWMAGGAVGQAVATLTEQAAPGLSTVLGTVTGVLGGLALYLNADKLPLFSKKTSQD
ncbi:MAG: hypothetical protein HY319_13255 [Armatimonadetes bacterium]|nr:hypothetical protein [Armatimonadota bacterium]